MSMNVKPESLEKYFRVDGQFNCSTCFCPFTSLFSVQEAIFILEKSRSWIQDSVTRGSMKLSGTPAGREQHPPSEFTYFDLLEAGISESAKKLIAESYLQAYSQMVSEGMAEAYDNDSTGFPIESPDRTIPIFALQREIRCITDYLNLAVSESQVIELCESVCSASRKVISRAEQVCLTPESVLWL